jgi:serine/threonine-protein kinase HipA
MTPPGNEDKALVYYGPRLAGYLFRNREGKGGYEFEYDPSYLVAPDAMPISLTLPVRKEKYKSEILFPFFEGLLPEGWLLELASETLKISKRDKFALLLHTGSDTIGAVTVKPSNEKQNKK